MNSVTGRPPSTGGWTFLTNHAHVLLCLASDPTQRVREVAARVGITERAAMRIIGDLVDGGYLVRRRVGRRTSYGFHLDQPMRHPAESARQVAALVDLMVEAWRADRAVG